MKNLLLHIDTAQSEAMVSLSDNEALLATRYHNEPRSHAEFLQPAIREMILDSGYDFQQLKAVSVSNGPGSYTGLRVGLSAAKGLCFALRIPLISLSTLEIMAKAAWMEKPDVQWVCPMIDARRMEVFTAVYDAGLKAVEAPHALILDEHAFERYLEAEKIFFLGSGSEKWKKICGHSGAVFGHNLRGAEAQSVLAYRAYTQQVFADLAYTEPMYVKEFFDAAQ